mgnify:CR=1 FL=1
MDTIPIADAHCHLNPIKGIGVKTLGTKFKSQGGWYLGIVSLSPSHLGYELSLRGYEKTFQTIVKSCRELKSLGLKYCIHLGFHPAEVDKLMNSGLNAKQTLELGLRVINLACSMIERGEAHGIGEVGIQHYKTSEERVRIAEEIMKYSLIKARDLKVPIHLHLDQNPSTLMKVKNIVVEMGYDAEKIVIHHITPELLEKALKLNFSTTIVGKTNNLIFICRRNLVTLIESDYLDDPKRPGAVIVPWSICRNWRKLLNKGVCDEEFIYRINVEEIERLYGVHP